MASQADAGCLPSRRLSAQSCPPVEASAGAGERPKSSSTLTNCVQPVLRYDLGDRVRISPEDCPPRLAAAAHPVPQRGVQVEHLFARCRRALQGFARTQGAASITV